MGHATRVYQLLGLGVLVLAACSSSPAQQPSFPIAMTGGPAVTGQPPGVTSPTNNTTPPTKVPPGPLPGGAGGAMTPGAAGRAPLTPSDPVVSPVGGAGMPAVPSIPPVVEPEYKDGKLDGTCPDGFMPR